MALIERTQDRFLAVLTIVLVIGIFALDLTRPTEAPIATLYGIPILLSLLSAERWLALAITILSLSFATLGFLPLLHDEPIGRVALTNRALALVALTTVACLGLFHRRPGEGATAAPARQCGHPGPRSKGFRGLLPICASCKNIRDDNGCWTYLETYIESRSDAHFTHSLCPECLQKLCDSLEKRGREKQDELLLTR